MSQIQGPDTILLGVSVDDEASHKKFQEEEEFGFPLLADTDFEVSKVYSGIMEKFQASNRSTFVIDKAGYIRAIDRNVNTQTHGEDLVKLIEENIPGPIQVGQPAPDLIASDQDGNTYQLSSFEGKRTLC